MTPEFFPITSFKTEIDGVFTVELKPKGGKFEFSPGQFNMLYVFGVGEVPISISGDPKVPEKLVHTIRDVGAVTHKMSQLKPSEPIGVRGPFGKGWPVESAKGKDVVIVAGGLGLAPLRPVIYQVLAQRKKFKGVSVVIGARTPEGLLFRDEIKNWKKKINVFETVDAAGPDWKGSVGVVTNLLDPLSLDDDAIAFLCGPEIMMRFCSGRLIEKGLQSQNLYLSLERNMKCAIAQCGHCQYEGDFICQDGPVFSYEKLRRRFSIREL